MTYCRGCNKTVENIDYTAVCSSYGSGEWTIKCCYDCSDQKYEKPKFAFKKTGRTGREVVEDLNLDCWRCGKINCKHFNDFKNTGIAVDCLAV